MAAGSNDANDVEVNVPEVAFENTRTGKRYKVVSMNKEAGTITLVGPHGVPFDEKYNKERFQQLGYVLVQEGAAAAPAAPASAPPPPVNA